MLPLWLWEGKECLYNIDFLFNIVVINSIYSCFSTENFLDCVVLACWRRVQSWNIVSIIAEFRQHTWPHKLFDYEQLIEAFDVKLVDVESLAPEFYNVHLHLKVLQ